MNTNRLAGYLTLPMGLRLLPLGVACVLCVAQTQGEEGVGTDRHKSEARAVHDEHDVVVMSWNLEFFFDNQTFDNRSELAKEKSAPDRARWDWRRDAVAESILAVSPEILAVQEVESGKVMSYLASAISRIGGQKYRVSCIEGADPFTEQDVAFLYNDDAWLRREVHHRKTRAMQKSRDYYSAGKHLEAEFEFGPAGDPEVITVVNLHLRARPEKSDVRVRQARLVHHWIAERVKAGENVIVLGDFNTEEPADNIAPQSDLWYACGKHTPDKDDDLFDLHARLPPDQRQTHLIEGKAFDRILVSAALIADAPDRNDLVLRSIERPRELCVKGDGPDSQQRHWDAYWQLDADQRDLSDHWPLVARFQWK